MKPLDEGQVPPVATCIDPTRDMEEYDRKARHLRVLIKNATGKDISSFPTSVQQRLDTLARTAALLGLNDLSPSAYLAALSKVSSDQLQVQLHLIQLKKVEEELRTAVALAGHRQRVVTSWNKSTGVLSSDTASLERQKKALNAKAKEYQLELSAATSESPSEKDDIPTITSLIALQEQLRQKERDLKAQKARLEAFDGLPPNLGLAKLELANARENQIRLMNTREKLLGRMTQGLS